MTNGKNWRRKDNKLCKTWSPQSPSKERLAVHRFRGAFSLRLEKAARVLALNCTVLMVGVIPEHSMNPFSAPALFASRKNDLRFARAFALRLKFTRRLAFMKPSRPPLAPPEASLDWKCVPFRLPFTSFRTSLLPPSFPSFRSYLPPFSVPLLRLPSLSSFYPPSVTPPTILPF